MQRIVLVVLLLCAAMLGKGRKQKLCEDDGTNRADAGGLEDCAKARDLTTSDALLLRLGGKKVLDEGNNAFGSSGKAVLPQDCFRQAREPRRLGWFGSFGQEANLICHLRLHTHV